MRQAVSPSALPNWLTTLTRPLAPVSAYTAGWNRRARRRRQIRLPVPTVSIGNLVAGGTGKTPAAQSVARMLIERGLRVGVVMSAYRAQQPLQDGVGGSLRWAVVSDGETLLADVETAGDEAIMFAVANPKVPLAVGRRKAAVAQQLVANYELDCVVIDDGFQHVRLARDLDIVLLDARRALDNGRVLPAGALREPPEALRYADIVGVTHATRADDVEAARQLVARYGPRATVVAAKHIPAGLRLEPDGHEIPMGELAGVDVLAVCGIGNPAGFERSLVELGARVALRAFPDHHRYRGRDFDDLGRRAGGRTVVTTAKDAVKWIGNVAFPFWVLEVRLEWFPTEPIAHALLALVNQNGPKSSCGTFG